jgi:plasmid stabilization system protein ParE
MDRYHIELTGKATDDIIRLGKYISVELWNPEAARKLVDNLYEAIKSLEEIPHRQKALEDDLYIIPEGIRRVFVDNYGIYYITDEDKLEVIVLRVLYNKREWQNLL